MLYMVYNVQILTEQNLDISNCLINPKFSLTNFVYERGYMKRMMIVFALSALLITSAPLFAADSKDTANTCNSCVQTMKTPGKTIFNSLSDFFSTFDRPFTRPGNKQGFWNATADWMRNINKQ